MSLDFLNLCTCKHGMQGIKADFYTFCSQYTQSITKDRQLFKNVKFHKIITKEKGD